jgi:hypothetical protein
MGDRFASHCPTELRQAVSGAGSLGGFPTGDGVPEPDWVGSMAALDDCDGYVVLVVDPQTAEVDAHGPYGGPDAAIAADSLTTSLTAEGLDDVVVRIVRLHLPRTAA